MGKKGIETLVGLFVLLGMLGLVFLALKAANLTSFGGGDTYSLTAKFDNIGGLKPRAAVRSAGVTVGRVASITLDAKTYQGVVRLEIDKGVQFPKDSQAFFRDHLHEYVLPRLTVPGEGRPPATVLHVVAGDGPHACGGWHLEVEGP